MYVMSPFSRDLIKKQMCRLIKVFTVFDQVDNNYLHEYNIYTLPASFRG